MAWRRVGAPVGRCAGPRYGRGHAGAHPLDDQAALQLGEGADEDEQRLAQRAAGVDLLAEADELEVEPAQLIEHLEEVLSRPGDAVAAADQDEVEPAAPGIAQQRVQAGAAGLGPRDRSTPARSHSRAGRPHLGN